jgi:enoyl-CoA hydratase/carnithine racemase
MQGLEDISCFKVTLAENIATVTIDRPPVNAQNRLFRDEIAEEKRRLDARDAGKQAAAIAEN